MSSLAFSYDGQLLACGGLDGVVQICDASSGNLKCVLDGPGLGIEVKPLLILCKVSKVRKYLLLCGFFFQWIRWHPRGHVVLAGSEDCSLWMWNADKGVYLNMFSGHNQGVTCGDFTPDGIYRKKNTCA